MIYINKRHKWSLKKAEQWFLTTDINFRRLTALLFKNGYNVDYLENPYTENQPPKFFRLLNSYFACHHMFIINVDCQYVTQVLDSSIQNAAIMSVIKPFHFLYVCFFESTYMFCALLFSLPAAALQKFLLTKRLNLRPPASQRRK